MCVLAAQFQQRFPLLIISSSRQKHCTTAFWSRAYCIELLIKNAQSKQKHLESFRLNSDLLGCKCREQSGAVAECSANYCFTLVMKCKLFVSSIAVESREQISKQTKLFQWHLIRTLYSSLHCPVSSIVLLRLALYLQYLPAEVIKSMTFSSAGLSCLSSSSFRPQSSAVKITTPSSATVCNGNHQMVE